MRVGPKVESQIKRRAARGPSEANPILASAIDQERYHLAFGTQREMPIARVFAGSGKV